MDGARLDTDLPNIMSCLDIIDEGAALSPSPSKYGDNQVRNNNMTLRRRKSLVNADAGHTNRRVILKPRKKLPSESSSQKQLEALYLNKKIKTTSHTLETIFEEPKPEKNETITLVGGKKVKRLLTCQLGNHYTKEKIKKRRAKIKKLFGNKGFINRKKIPMQAFLKTFKCLELDETKLETTPHNVVD